MSDAVPLLPISQDQLQHLVAALLVYRLYRQKKTPPTEERMHTLIVLELLIQKLNLGIDTQEAALPLLLMEEDVSVIKAGLATLLDSLKRRVQPPKIKREMQQLRDLKTVIEQAFKIAQN